ncbi:hypothetical protein ACJX0J_036265, partial [Zea mays]
DTAHPLHGSIDLVVDLIIQHFKELSMAHIYDIDLVICVFLLTLLFASSLPNLSNDYCHKSDIAMLQVTRRGYELVSIKFHVICNQQIAQERDLMFIVQGPMHSMILPSITHFIVTLPEKQIPDLIILPYVQRVMRLSP